MPEFLVSITYSTNFTEFRTADDARHARRILAGLKGRYPGRALNVYRIGQTDDVTADFVAKREA